MRYSRIERFRQRRYRERQRQPAATRVQLCGSAPEKRGANQNDDDPKNGGWPPVLNPTSVSAIDWKEASSHPKGEMRRSWKSN